MKKIITIIMIFICIGLNAKDQEGTVSEKEGLKIREKADKSSKQTGFIPFQEKVTIIEENGPAETLYGIKSRWMRIKYKNTTGWAFGGFIDKGGKWENCPPSEMFGDCTFRPRDLNFEYLGKEFFHGINCDGLINHSSSKLTLSSGNKAVFTWDSDARDENRPECTTGVSKGSETGTYRISNGSLEIRFTQKKSNMSFNYYEGHEMKKAEWNKKCGPKTEKTAIDEKLVLLPYECKRKNGKISNVFRAPGDEYFYGVREK